MWNVGICRRSSEVNYWRVVLMLRGDAPHLSCLLTYILLLPRFSQHFDSFAKTLTKCHWPPWISFAASLSPPRERTYNSLSVALLTHYVSLFTQPVEAHSLKLPAWRTSRYSELPVS